jgi:hypothetical protein
MAAYRTAALLAIMAAAICASPAAAAPADSITRVQLSMGRNLAPNRPPLRKKTTAPAKPESGLTADERKRLAAALSHLTPKQQKQLAKAVKRLTPEERSQVQAVLKRQLRVKGNSSRVMTRAQ